MSVFYRNGKTYGISDYSANNVTYDNSESGLEAVNTQDAIDKVKEKITDTFGTAQFRVQDGEIQWKAEGADTWNPFRVNTLIGMDIEMVEFIPLTTSEVTSTFTCTEEGYYLLVGVSAEASNTTTKYVNHTTTGKEIMHWQKWIATNGTDVYDVLTTSEACYNISIFYLKPDETITTTQRNGTSATGHVMFYKITLPSAFRMSEIVEEEYSNVQLGDCNLYHVAATRIDYTTATLDLSFLDNYNKLTVDDVYLFLQKGSNYDLGDSSHIPNMTYTYDSNTGLVTIVSTVNFFSTSSNYLYLVAIKPQTVIKVVATSRDTTNHTITYDLSSHNGYQSFTGRELLWWFPYIRSITNTAYYTAHHYVESYDKTTGLLTLKMKDYDFPEQLLTEETTFFIPSARGVGQVYLTHHIYVSNTQLNFDLTHIPDYQNLTLENIGTIHANGYRFYSPDSGTGSNKYVQWTKSYDATTGILTLTSASRQFYETGCYDDLWVVIKPKVYKVLTPNETTTGSTKTFDLTSIDGWEDIDITQFAFFPSHGTAHTTNKTGEDIITYQFHTCDMSYDNNTGTLTLAFNVIQSADITIEFFSKF